MIDTTLVYSASAASKKTPRLYDFGEAFEIDLSHEFQLYTFASTPRSSSDNFSLTLHFTKRVRNLTLLILGASSLIFIFPPKQNLIDFSPPGSHYLLNITVGIPDMIKLGWLLN